MKKLDTLKPPELPTVELVLDPQGRLALHGVISSREPDRRLSTFFKALHDAAVEDSVAELKVDVRGLSFVNSSALRLFIDWTTWVAKAEGHCYKLCFIHNPEVTWQRVSFAALRHLAKDGLTIEAAS